MRWNVLNWGLELESRGLLCSLEIELLSNRKSAWYFIFTSLFIRLQFKFNQIFTASMSDLMGYESSRSRWTEFGRIIYYNVKFISIQMVGFKISWPKNLMDHDAVDLTKCLFSQLPIFTQFTISCTFARKNWKLGTSWTWVCSLAVLATSLRAFLSIRYCYYPFYLFIFIYLFSGFNLIFT